MKRKMTAICLGLLLILSGCSQAVTDTDSERIEPESLVEVEEQIEQAEPDEPDEPDEPEEPEEKDEPIEQEAGESFPYTPQELIDILNDTASNDDSRKALLLDDYVESGEAIWPEDGSVSFMLTLEQNDSKMLEDAYFFWTNEQSLNVQYTVGLYCGTMLAVLLPDHAEQVAEDFDSIFSSGSGFVEYTFDGVYVGLELLKDYGWFDIRIAE